MLMFCSSKNGDNITLWNCTFNTRKVGLILLVLTLGTLFMDLSSQPLSLLPCRGQMFINGSFHVGQLTSTSFNVYDYNQEFWNNENDLDCCFNEGSVFDWTIERVDITSSGGVVCLGGGLGFPWYRFRLYGRNYSKFHADIWVSWRTTPRTLPASPSYLMECVYKETDTVVM